MIKIYLDWNIISKLKRKEGEELKNALMKNKNSFVFPFSAAHLRDLRRGDQATRDMAWIKLNYQSFAERTFWNIATLSTPPTLIAAHLRIIMT